MTATIFVADRQLDREASRRSASALARMSDAFEDAHVHLSSPSEMEATCGDVTIRYVRDSDGLVDVVVGGAYPHRLTFQTQGTAHAGFVHDESHPLKATKAAISYVLLALATNPVEHRHATVLSARATLRAIGCLAEEDGRIDIPAGVVSRAPTPWDGLRCDALMLDGDPAWRCPHDDEVMHRMEALVPACVELEIRSNSTTSIWMSPLVEDYRGTDDPVERLRLLSLLSPRDLASAQGRG